MAYGRYIVIKGPDRQGEFVATMPDGDTRLVIYWEDLDALKAESGVQDVYGDLRNLTHRVRPRGAHPDFMPA